MLVLYLINIISYLFIEVYKIYYLSRYFKIGFLNPISLQFMVSFPVIIMKVYIGPMFMLDNGLFNLWYNYALFLTNISLLIQFFIIYFTLKFAERNSFINHRLLSIVKPYKPKKYRMIIAALFFLLLSFLTFLMLSKDFGILNWLLNPREGYQFYRTGKGHWYALTLLFLSTSYTIVMLYIRNFIMLFFTFIIYISLIYILGSKGFILSFVIFFAIILWLRKFRYLKLTIMVLSLIGFLLMLLNFKPADIFYVIAYFDYYVNSAMYFQAYFKGEIDLFYGKIWLTSFYGYLPRALFPEKPYVYGFLYVNEFFYPGLAEESHTPAFGGPIEAFADFGFIGVILFELFNFKTILNTILLYLLYKNIDLQSIRSNSNNLYLFIWMLAPAYMTFFGSVYSVVLFVIIMKVISFFNRVKI